MITFEQFVLSEQDPMAGGAPPGGGLGAPGGLPGGMGGGPPGGGLGAPGGLPGGDMGMGGGMGGGPGGMGGGQVKPTKTDPTDVWKTLEKILEGKPIKHEKQARPQHQNMLDSGQAPGGMGGGMGGMPPAGPPPGPMGAGPIAGSPPMAGGPMSTPPGGMGGGPMGM